MIPGQFRFLSNQYYSDFSDDKLMRNKEVIDGFSHSRPCFFTFQDKEYTEIYWLIPISSKTEKYKTIYNKKVKRYGHCNTIIFGNLLDTDAVFLIQNMCPATEHYIKEVYKDRNDNPIQMDHRIVTNVIKNARQVLALERRGIHIVFPNIQLIYETLLTPQNPSNLLSDIPAPAQYSSLPDSL